MTVMGAIVNHGLPPGVGAAGEGAASTDCPEHLRQGLADAIHPAFFAAACVGR